MASLISVSVRGRQFYVLDWACAGVKTFRVLSMPAGWISFPWEEDHIPLIWRYGVVIWCCFQKTTNPPACVSLCAF